MFLAFERKPTYRHIATLVSIALEKGGGIRLTSGRAQSTIGELQVLAGMCDGAITRGAPQVYGEPICKDLCSKHLAESFTFMSEDVETAVLKAKTPRPWRCFYANDASTQPNLTKFIRCVTRGLNATMWSCVTALVLMSKMKATRLILLPRSVHRMFLGALVVAMRVNGESLPAELPDYLVTYGVDDERVRTLEAATMEVLGKGTRVSPAEFTLMLYSLRSVHAQAVERAVEVGSWSSVALSGDEQKKLLQELASADVTDASWSPVEEKTVVHFAQ